MEENCGRTPGDGELALAVQAGAPEAFDQLSARYLGLLRARAGQFARPGGLEKEDLIQEGFLGLYAAAMAYNPQGALAPMRGCASITAWPARPEAITAWETGP